MRPWVAGMICLLFGLAAGAAGSYAFVGHYAGQMFDQQYEIQCLDHINILRQLKAGKANGLEANLLARLPQWAAGVPVVVNDSQRANNILWAVQRFYEQNQIVPPENLRIMLESLPPRPPTSCDAKRSSETAP